ncbi:MAG TPA: alpha-amylase family glycosyl hydrolase [Verrucomicrobiae bacterium]|nr:alpha-amylase family glycosyl hydrolase [Verrucomicrobiae bacterium]
MARYPSLLQVNTRVLLAETARQLGRRATLDDIPGGELDRIAAEGFEWVWFLGIWQTGTASREIAGALPELRREFQEALADFTEQDVCGSCFAVQAYAAHSDFGGNAALDRLRQRLHDRGLRLMLDFVPNHTAREHRWVAHHPEYYVHGTAEQLAREPRNFTRVDTPAGPAVLAHGRDPYFPGWSDTLQLNYANPELQEAMAAELESIAAMCDGVRCDMAMLVLPEVFERTWGMKPAPFWPGAIARARAHNSGFLFLAEVYWDLEWTLQQEGFDFTYDKRLYDRLRGGRARPIHDHLRATMEFQRKCARFLENHDEPRAAAAFAPGTHEAAAVLAYLSPGMRFFQRGQSEGFKKKVPVQLCRGPAESADSRLRAFYGRLLECLRHRAVQGEWQLLDSVPAWYGNWTWSSFIGFAWQAPDRTLLLAIVNYAPGRSQCYLPLGFPDLAGKTVRLRDLMGPFVYDREGDELQSRGLYLDLPAWGYHVLEVRAS